MTRIIFAILFFHQFTFAQESLFEHELGISGGLANYYGDLNENFGIQGIGPSASIFIRNNIGTRFAIKSMVSYMNFSASDKNASSEYLRNRNLSFRSDVFEIALLGEINFLDFVRSIYYKKQGYTFSPYLTFGTDVFFFNPQAYYNGRYYDLQPLGTEGQTDYDYTGRSKYKLFNFSIVYGGGFKYHVAKNLSVGLDFLIRRTFTDYLDDVSTTYVPVISLPLADKGIAYHLADRSGEVGKSIGEAGRARGSNTSNDDFASLSISLSWVFLKSPCFGK
jgi:hypothetical protein